MPDPHNLTAVGPTVSANPHRWRVLTLLAVAQFMLILDVTVVAIALPTMGVDLGLDREQITWVVSAYTLAFGGLMLLGGRVADLAGPRPVVLAGLAVFVGASLLAGAADSATLMLTARAAQGVGAAMLSPAALSVVVRMFDGEERNRALGIWSALGGGGAAVGVLAGGVLVAGPGWPWVFWVNVPVGGAVAAGLLLWLPQLPASAWGQTGRPDYLGAALVTASTGAALYAIISASEAGRTWLWVLAAAIGYLLFTRRQRTATSPLMDLGLLSRRTVTAGVFTIAIATGLMVAVFFLGSYYLQGVSGLGAFSTGIRFLPVALLTMAGAHVGGRYVATLGARRLGCGALMLASVGLAVPATNTNATSVLVGISLAAAGIGALFVVAAASAFSQVSPHEAGIASGVLSTFHEFGASIGVAVVSAVVASSLVDRDPSGFSDAFVVAATIAVASLALVGVLLPGRGAVETATQR